MIAIDASALRAILAGDEEARFFVRMIAENDCLIGAPTRLEAVLAARRAGPSHHSAALDAVFLWRNVETVAIGIAHLAAAEVAARQMSRSGGLLLERLTLLDAQGREPAAPHDPALNLGACLSYAVARVAAVPLLFKGGDLSRTDIEPAWRP